MSICRRCGVHFPNQFDNIPICPDCVIEAENTVLRDIQNERTVDPLKKYNSEYKQQQRERIVKLERENADLKSRNSKLKTLVAEMDDDAVQYEKDIDNLKVQLADRDRREGELVTDIADLHEKLNEIKAALPDDFSPSKDWQQGSSISRIEWLKLMYRDCYWQLEECLRQIEMLEDQDMPSVGSYAKRYNELCEAAAWYMECIESGRTPPSLPWTWHSKMEHVYDVYKLVKNREREWQLTVLAAERALRAMLKEVE